jgi:hypothetical protein
MTDQSENRKGCNLKKCLIMSGLLVLLTLQTGAEQKGKMILGIYGGWSIGPKSPFGEHSVKYYTEWTDLVYHLGGYARYNITERFGLQLNYNYQGIVHRSYYWDWYGTSIHVKRRLSFRSLNLSVLYNWLKWKNVQFYLLAGVGLTYGKFAYFDDSYFNYMGGTGIKLFLKKDSRTALNLGFTFHHLMDPNLNATTKANYQSFQIGCEF